MYGTIAKVRLRQDVSADEAERAFESLDRPEGSLGVFTLRCKSDAHELWIGGVFESEEVYYASAGSPQQTERFAKLRELMDGDPEWHDGEVINFTKY